MCSIAHRDVRFSRAMIFAVEEINNSSELLPGIRLGYQIHDSCASVPVAVHAAFHLTNGQDPVFYTGVNCSQSGNVVGVVGESGSTPSISMSRVFGPFDIPMVINSNIWQNVLLKYVQLFIFILFFHWPLKELHCRALL